MNICKNIILAAIKQNNRSVAFTQNVINRNVSVVTSTLPVPSNSEPEPESDKLYKYLELELRGNDPAVLRSFAKFSLLASQHLNIEGKGWALRKPQHDRLTLLKSVHIYKKHRVQYEYRTYFHFLKFLRLTGSTADTFLEYLERNLPEGVALKTTKVELQSIPDHIKPSPSQSTDATLKECQ